MCLMPILDTSSYGTPLAAAPTTMGAVTASSPPGKPAAARRAVRNRQRAVRPLARFDRASEDERILPVLHCARKVIFFFVSLYFYFLLNSLSKSTPVFSTTGRIQIQIQSRRPHDDVRLCNVCACTM